MPTASGHTKAIRAKKVIGTNVKDPSGKKIGEVEDVMLDKESNNIMFAVVGFGGFLGVAEKYHPIPWSALEFNEDEDAYVVNYTKEQLQSAPTASIDELTRGDGQMFEAATQFGMRLPELYCGFARIPGQGPTPYPVACIPQAWSCGAVFMLLQACLGLEIDGARKEIRIEKPLLPIGIESIRLNEIAVGEARIDLSFERVQQQVIVAAARDALSGVKVYVHL